MEAHSARGADRSFILGLKGKLALCRGGPLPILEVTHAVLIADGFVAQELPYWD